MRLLLMAAMAQGSWSMANAQVIISGNVYGGGNQGNVGGSTRVTVRSCVVQGDVFGGARMADIGKRTFVNIDGANASDTLYITTVYGGNDIAGTIGAAIDPTDTLLTEVPAELTEVLRAGQTKASYPEKNYVNNTWNAFVRTSKMPTENQTHRLIIGRIFGGGNGDYSYTDGSVDGKYNVTINGTTYEDVIKPVLGKTYLEITGGEVAHLYGGGNNVTVTDNTTICINNSSKGVVEVLDPTRMREELAKLAGFLNLSMFQGNYSSLDFTHGRIFGGNNKAEMDIRPVWNIQKGKIRDLYSGGNEGNMTSPDGLILDINPIPANRSQLTIYNVYGGCRRADVHPANPATAQLPNNLGYQFPAGLPARTVVRGGHITNVYGGNDISGRVFGGNAVGIYTTVYGDVYGGGNGSYAYTDNAELGGMSSFKDFYYNPADVKAKERQYNDENFDYSSDNAAVQSVEALNIFRPNAEQVSIRLKGESASNPTIIAGSVYLGGNSATLKTATSTHYAAGSEPMVELKIGSHVFCNSVFLGDNGENMVTEDILHRYAKYLDEDGNTVDTPGDNRYDFSQMDLTIDSVFAKYMDGCAMSLRPRVVFDSKDNHDPDDYENYSSYFGSFYCGGNRGSMTWSGTNTINFNKKVIVTDKFVGGCNNANIAETQYNALYLGGMIGTAVEQKPGGMEDANGNIKDCLVFNFSGLKMQPMRWKDETDPTQGIEWNTFDERTNADVDAPEISGDTESTEDDIYRRLRNGNIYGGCYESGHINGNIVINLLDDIVDKDKVFDVVEKESELLYDNNSYTIKKRNSGVILDEQGMDPLGLALNVFGGGYGKDSEVWGSTTVNLKAGYTFQIFGGGQQGPIGKSREDNNEAVQTGDYVFYGKHYAYDSRYSTYVNLMDTLSAGGASNDVAEADFIYGGSFEAPIMGNTRINLCNGRIFNSFAGSCNADILGHTETYVGSGLLKDGTAIEGFPYIIDHIYGGNDLGGSILGEKRAEQYPSTPHAMQALADCDFTDRVNSNGQAIEKVYQYNSETNTNPSALTASAYIEYTKGRVLSIFGGAYGDYDYTSEKYREFCNADGSNKAGFNKPRLGNAFINIKPVSNSQNTVSEVYGAGQGQHYVIERDSMQERSYILVDIPQNQTQFDNTLFFGAGAFSGLGMEIAPATVKANPDRASAVIDLLRGQIKNVYGGSYKEGVTRRTVVNVPEGSTIALNNIFGGAYGVTNLYPCDVYESVVNYRSEREFPGGIYGGNNNARRTLYSQVNIYAKLWNNQARGYTGYVYGGGLGSDTWSQYTEVNLCDGSWVYKVYGGGSAGKVLNKTSLMKWKAANPDMDLRIGNGYNGADGKGYGYEEYDAENGLAKYFEMANDIDAGYIREAPDRGIAKKKFNTNVRILTGGFVEGYCYGGGYGSDAIVSGDTYIALVGGKVKRDIYAAGESGAVRNLYEAAGSKTFTATANAYVKAGDVRNIYGGGWRGDVGYHLETTQDTTNDDLGLSNVVIGNLRPDASYTDGDPAIERNAYGAGEGGSVFGKSCLTINNGHIGYKYDAETEKYVEVLDDANVGDNLLDDSGNAFGGGYVANSYTDESYVTMYGGVVRGGLYGGGEIGPVGRGALRTDNDTYFPPTTAANMNHEAKIYKPGSTNVYMYGGHVLRDVFGGGRGFDNWGGDGTFYYSAEDIAKMDLMAKGYVFGSTNVFIRGGEIGTKDGVAKGYGNVFGGGNIGFVYSGTGRKVGTKVTDDDDLVEGMPTDGGGYYYEGGNKNASMTLDSNVDVAPYCMVTSEGGITIDGTSYAKGVYVPTEALNKIRNKKTDAAEWAKLDLTGITIHNAVFAGGNVSVGSDQIYANANTVYGNASAALRDIFHNDLITIGTEHTGGIYGDGNLTFVDGYRELHIGNYGTDYYTLSDNITLEEYHKLNDRERAYFELQYECQQTCSDKNGKSYVVKARLSADEYKTLFEGTEYYNESYWKEYGFCSIYAGRLLNTIQRADMVGVFGSRLVLQGARDRVPEKADYTNYTINRVGEVSLNRVRSIAPGEIPADTIHGNYFGIYSVVNYLGNLTSDVFMADTRVTDVNETNEANKADGKSYHDWKVYHKDKRNRNNGVSDNKVALASGVYLEIQRETSEGKEKPDWGYITGVVQLDLINVMTGMGGGYVYAKNEHRTKVHHDDWQKVILSPYNANARTYKKFSFTDTIEDIETSGNFIHNTKQIIDDCYPTANKYKGADAAPAHYWYIKGSIYLYDQYISAYTGSATAYSERVSLPLTITAASHGQMKLSDIQPNYYAYYNKEHTKLGANDSVLVNNVHYVLNEPITYWDYSQLSFEDKKCFERETYVTVAECRIGETVYPKGYVLLPDDYTSLLEATTDSIYNVERDEKVLFTDIFRPSNNLGHDKGYLLTYEVSNPMVWDKWYTSTTGGLSNRKNTEQYNNETGYTPGPTYSVKAGRGGVYGQREYSQGDIITKEVYDTYTRIPSENRDTLSNQAHFEQAYVVKIELTTKNKDNLDQHLYPGSTIAKSDYTEAQWNAIVSSVDSARVVTSTLDLGGGEYIYAGDLLTQADIDDIVARYDDQTDASVKEYLDLAYYCTAGGNYGGNLYVEGTAYKAIDTWCSMSAADRNNFQFNYDALDVLLDPTYGGQEGQKRQYDSETYNPLLYSGAKPIDYEAVYNGTNFTYYKSDGTTEVLIEKDHTYSRQQYEAIPNEQYYYSPIEVTAPGTYYVVRAPFVRGERPYAAGEVISSEFFDALNDDQKLHIDQIEFDSTKTNAPTTVEGKPVYEPKYYYYRRESYVVGKNGYQYNDDTELTVTDVFDSLLTYTKGQTVDQLIIISDANYKNLVNLQKDNFTIVGNSPVEVSTLYVSRESDIHDLSKEKIITVVYLYEYQESDESGTHITPISERHIVNIHIQFKSGVPEIGQLTKPNTVLPGSAVGLKVPTVTPGAYEVLNSGWEIFSNPQDALSHKNGQPYYNNSTPMYWYQDGYLVAYYAKTYLGKTYSNAVEFSVGNYHDIGEVMADSLHHMYIDHKDVSRAPKIYIDGRTSAVPGKSKLDLLKDLYELTLHEAEFDSDNHPIAITEECAVKGHSGVNTSMIGAGKGLELILKSNVSPTAYTDWTPIGTDSEHCFDGTLHGDGYTISGLNNSLFNDLCGEVYNLGVTGSFTSAGIVNTGKGYVENCWVKSTAENVNSSVKAVFGNPTDDHGTQVVNCYYPETNAYSETSHARGNARKMPVKAFNNGEVAYDLNGFYLQKRYFDHKPQTTGTQYSYFVANGDGTLSAEPSTGYYTSDYAIYPLNPNKAKIYGYVEDRYADGDFIYAGGSVPESSNERLYTHPVNGDHYYPIWPDDYLFFGQMLTYGHVANRDYQELPSHINKSGGRLTTTATSVNRVYRAPAYFQSKEMGVAHYNPYAIFAAQNAAKNKDIYPHMTAIDFTGGNGDVAGGYKQGLNDNKFFAPLLDDDGLAYFRNVDLTKNLLAYVPDATENATDAATKTHEVVIDYLVDPDYAESNATYRTVAPQDAMQIHGHAVVKKGDNYVAHENHLLVDKNDFNAPISYSFDSDYRMWYQRVPDTYVDLTKGWEGISLPFSAELVTTQTKGEITHFYEKSNSIDENNHTKIGHEYWLREFKGNVTEPDGEGIATGDFNYPAAGSDGDKEVTNTFLWNYYYKYNGSPRLDQNTDTYQQDCYADSRTYEDYAYTEVAKPYIIGFPGTTYYEFDLSGGFTPSNTQAEVTSVPRQTITFASRKGISIAVSDDEMAAAKVVEGNYTFWPNYLGKSIEAGSFLLNTEGSSYEKQDVAVDAVPFRPYITYQSSGARENKVRAITFNRSKYNIGVEDRDPSEGAVGLLNVYAKKGRVVVESTLNVAADVRIVTSAGTAVQIFTIQPGETIDTRINYTGVYIVSTSNGQTKKLRVEAR